MPFDPDAYLASKSPAAAPPAPAAGGFDPDAYLASKKPAATPAPTPTPAPRGALRTYVDSVKAPIDMAMSAGSSLIAAPIANVAGLAATGYEAATKGGKGDGEMPGKFRDAVERRLTYHPDNSVLDAAGKVAAPALKAASNFGTAVKDFAKGGQADDTARGMAVNAATEGAKQGLGMLGVKAAPKVPGAIDVLTGETARAARGDALKATRTALGDVDAAHGRTQAAKLTEAQTYEDVATRTQRELDAARQRQGVPTADVIGGQVRDSYLKVMADAKAAREAAVDPLYTQAKEAAKAREAVGARVNVKPALTDLDAMIQASENIPDLNNKLLRLRQSMEPAPTRAGPQAPLGSGKVSSKIKPPPVAATTEGLTYEQLDMASRYIKDIAFSGEAEGYGALVRNTAKKLSMSLDKQISEFVPEHAAASAKYREMSAPMETMATRIGEALHETEGGLKGDAYTKVSAQDLPGRIFGRKDRIEQLVDAMAGGKTAAPEARAAAQAKVDTWVENWILDAKRGKVGDAARPDAPGQRAALNATPGAASRLGATLDVEQAKLSRVPELQAAAKESRAAAQAAEGAKLKVRQRIEQADLDLQHGSKDAAYKGYVEALRMNLAVADPERYKAAIALMERASTEEKRVALARKLAAGVAGAAGAGAAYKMGTQAPGLMQ